ncbi:hypothetical protein ID866_8542 [Astraeus odoratus]|nr:hypothetical protein ID866_8542 [Astraeus odoratus]
MPSHRDRDRDREREHGHDRTRSLDRNHDLPEGISPISESDYFVKNSEFSIWLKDEKEKVCLVAISLVTSARTLSRAYIGSTLMNSRATGREGENTYFRKFVKAWNRGKLPRYLYRGAGSLPVSKQTGYKWSFASKGSGADERAIKSVREEVDSATYSRSREPRGGSSANGGSNRVLGPTLPSASDLTLAREAASEYQAVERDLKRKRERAEAKDRIEDMVGPREVGREGMLEKKRARRENDKAFREKGDDGFEADESTLLGGGDSFRDHIARRDAARRRYEEKRASTRDDKEAMTRERTNAMREKEKATMDMFQQLAKERFG